MPSYVLSSGREHSRGTIGLPFREATLTAESPRCLAKRFVESAMVGHNYLSLSLSVTSTFNGFSSGLSITALCRGLSYGDRVL